VHDLQELQAALHGLDSHLVLAVRAAVPHRKRGSTARIAAIRTPSRPDSIAPDQTR
jgi:hypothetical protein